MEDRFERLTDQLLNINPKLTYGQARTWVEGLWEDFETTRAKAGRPYRGQDTTEQIVSKWLNQYGPFLDQYSSKKDKFAHLNKDDHTKH
ncbi:YfhJ family protein [Halalkalibacter urbisdiaboli]|uniref:YfhJ family protein n=1 Tax=Halalkalibacter urbisdiaboli TaxID=1960589 RepID=UPI000B4392B0|nr:YfhJ family protein [Halalkalibacter urbisdiaboli]